MLSNTGLIGPYRTANSSVATGVFGIQDHHLFVKNANWPVVGIPVSGYIAWYTAGSVSGTSWLDLSGNGYTATISGSGYSVTSATGNGASKSFNVLQGSTSTAIAWPSGILPATYTIFHVARYTGGARQRIFTGNASNWLSGFWSGYSGVAFHEGWITQNSSDTHGNNWVYSTDQNSLYRSNGVTRGSSGGSASTTMRVNSGQNSELSDFQISEIIVYNTTLSATNYALMETYLANKYGIT
jgi:hypothetical protein